MAPKLHAVSEDSELEDTIVPMPPKLKNQRSTPPVLAHAPSWQTAPAVMTHVASGMLSPHPHLEKHKLQSSQDSSLNTTNRGRFLTSDMVPRVGLDPSEPKALRREEV